MILSQLHALITMSIEVVGISLTVAATAISIYNAAIFSRQSKLLREQALLQRSQVYPFVRIKECSVAKNTFRLTLENKAKEPAFELGLLMNFVPCSGFKDGYWQFVEKLTFDENPEMKSGYQIDSVVPFRNKEGIARLYGEESNVYIAEPRFMFKNAAKKREGLTHMVDDFDRLKKRLTAQGIMFVAVMTSLVYKDVAETLNEHELIKNFVVDLRKHENLEQAYKEGIPFHQRAIEYEEIPCWEYEEYRALKSYRGFLKPFEY
jgi:hypothetical protein